MQRAAASRTAGTQNFFLFCSFLSKITREKLRSAASTLPVVLHAGKTPLGLWSKMQPASAPPSGRVESVYPPPPLPSPPPSTGLLSALMPTKCRRWLCGPLDSDLPSLSLCPPSAQRRSLWRSRLPFAPPLFFQVDNVNEAFFAHLKLTKLFVVVCVPSTGRDDTGRVDVAKDTNFNATLTRLRSPPIRTLSARLI